MRKCTENLNLAEKFNFQQDNNHKHKSVVYARNQLQAFSLVPEFQSHWTFVRRIWTAELQPKQQNSIESYGHFDRLIAPLFTKKNTYQFEAAAIKGFAQGGPTKILHLQFYHSLTFFLALISKCTFVPNIWRIFEFLNCYSVFFFLIVFIVFSCLNNK